MITKRWMLSAAAIVALGALAACETPTPYQPLQPASVSGQWGGYSEARVENDRWRVSFRGNDETPRATVESYMLYRAAELTLAQGYDWFEAAQRHTDTHTSGYAYDWGPGWGWGWGFHRRFWGDPFWMDDVTFDTTQRYDATVEIVLHHGPKPAENPHAFDARQVVANLGPEIARPSPGR